MGHLGRFTKTPYLVLFVILGTAGIGTAYAGILPLITLAGDVQVDGNLNVDGTITGAETLEGLSCGTDQVARWDGAQWVCNKIVLQGVPSKIAVDAIDDVGRWSSITLGNEGFPVISYFDDTFDDLKVAKCVNASCKGTSIITTVDTTDIVGLYTSITLGNDGFPVISYYDATNAELKVAKCVNESCTGTSTITIVDTALTDVGKWSSITLGNDGFPVISYFDDTFDDLKVAKCVNASCTGTSTITIVDTGSVGLYTSITLGNDGFPVISYYDNIEVDLKVAKCVNASCTGTSTITTVDAAGFVGRETSITLGNDGFPVISYFDDTNGDLKVAKCVNASCTGTSTLTAVDTVGTVGLSTSITLGNDGFPVISYHDPTNQDLKVAKCVNASCTGTSTITTVDAAEQVGQDSSITLGNDGFPVISYSDFTNDDLKVFNEGGSGLVIGFN